jgi:hypothetical protein
LQNIGRRRATLLQTKHDGRKEIFMATDDPRDDADGRRFRSPIRSGLILLGIYIAMYLAVGGVVHLLTSPDAAAVAPDISMARAPAAIASSRAESAGDSRSPLQR